MKNLRIQNFPETLYRRILRLAKANKLSLNAQVVDLLTRSIEKEEKQVKQAIILASIRKRQLVPSENMPSSLDLLREDRGH